MKMSGAKVSKYLKIGRRQNRARNGNHASFAIVFSPWLLILSPMATSQKLVTKPVDPSTWSDFEKLFTSKGGPSYCWCMAWRMTKEELRQNTSANRKKFIKQRVNKGIPIGLVGYLGDEPVAWCSVAPRDTHQRLGGDDTLQNVWSLTCFYIRKDFRDRGFVDKLIAAAKAYARKHGARYLEAYPVDPDSPSYRFMGFVNSFVKAGFESRGKAGTRRNVMVCAL